MKTLLKSLPFIILILCAGLGCKNMTNFVAGNSCQVDGQPVPKTSDDFVRRAGLHLDKVNYTQEFNACAYQDFDQAIKLDDKNFVAYSGRGLMLYYDKRLDQAKTDFDKAITLNPEYSVVYVYRAELHKDKGDLDSAIADMNKTIEISPAASDYDIRAELYELKNDYENAAKDYTSAIEMKNDGTTFRGDKEFSYYQLRAAAYRKLGKEDLAKQDDEALRTINKKYDGALTGEKTGDSRTVAGGLLNDKAIEMPKPPYPPVARAVRASGKVVVNIDVDTKGSVVKAEAVSGNPLLKAAAVAAARQAKFKPSSAPVSGSLEYEFNAPQP